MAEQGTIEPTFKFGDAPESMDDNEDFSGDLIEEEITEEQSEMLRRRYSVHTQRRSTVVGLGVPEK
jgi:hypothetical protein